MVDLQAQYERIKSDIDAGIKEVIDSAAFIKGPKVAEFGGAVMGTRWLKKVTGVKPMFLSSLLSGRGERTRTSDLHVPNVAR